MAELFSDRWMQKFKDEWNGEPAMVQELAQIRFNSSIAYGFVDEEAPRAVITVKKGKVDSVAFYQGQELNWDLRASPEDWHHWVKSPPGMMSLGIAYTTRKLVFRKGDYAAMIKDPRMAVPFVKSFSVMARV